MSKKFFIQQHLKEDLNIIVMYAEQNNRYISCSNVLYHTIEIAHIETH